jgi:flagellin-like protein
MKNRDKRGLSPIVATILLIALAVVLAGIIMIWARSWISEQMEKGGMPADRTCEKITFAIDHSNIPKIKVVNRGSVYISGISVEVDYGFSKKITNYDVTAHPGGSSQEVSILIDRSEGDPKKIIVYPQIIGNVKGKTSLNRAYTCTNQGQTINL